ncbi:MAG: response regulator [Bacteroidota bacterium]|nr:response regulator [Bacteroidota bacterium]
MSDKNKLKTSDMNWEKYKILVVEDAETNLMFIKAAIYKTGITILWARDGMEAIEKVQEDKSINVVLMDLRMPNLDGFRATEVIKSIRKDLPVIAQTTFTDEMDKERVFDAGCDAYLAKPIRLEILLETIDRFLPN